MQQNMQMHKLKSRLLCYAQHIAITVCTGPNRQFAVTIIVFVNIKFVFVKSIVFIPTQCVGLIIDRDVADKRYIYVNKIRM